MIFFPVENISLSGFMILQFTIGSSKFVWSKIPMQRNPQKIFCLNDLWTFLSILLAVALKNVTKNWSQQNLQKTFLIGQLLSNLRFFFIRFFYWFTNWLKPAHFYYPYSTINQDGFQFFGKLIKSKIWFLVVVLILVGAKRGFYLNQHN